MPSISLQQVQFACGDVGGRVGFDRRQFAPTRSGVLPALHTTGIDQRVGGLFAPILQCRFESLLHFERGQKRLLIIADSALEGAEPPAQAPVPGWRESSECSIRGPFAT